MLEARSHANQKVAQSEEQLVAVANLIIKLEEAVEEEKQILQLMNIREDIISSLINSQQSKQRCEEIYEAANKYLSLTTAKNLVKDLLADGNSELSLIKKLNHTSHNINGVSQNAVGTGCKRSHNSQQQTESFGEMVISESLDEHRSELASANKSVSDTLLKISNLEKEVARLETELKEKKKVNKDIDTKIKYQKVDILKMGDELSLLLKVC